MVMDKYILECTLEALDTLWPITDSYSYKDFGQRNVISMELHSQSEMGEK